MLHFCTFPQFGVLPIAQVTRAEQVDLCFGGKTGAIELFYSSATTRVRDENL